MFIRDLPSAYKNVLILTAGLLLLWTLYTISAIVMPFLASIVFAYILNPLVRLLEKIKIPRPYGVLCLYVLAIIAGILVVVPVSLNIVSEGHDLIVRLSKIDTDQLTSDYKVKARALMETYSQNPLLKNYLEVSLNSEKVQEFAARGVILFKDILVRVMQNMFSFFFKAFSGFMGFFFIPLLTFYLLVDLDMFYEKTTLLVPIVYRPSFIRISSDIDAVLSGFLRGQILACTIFGSLMTVGLWISGLNFFVLLGPIAGIANMVPYLGGLSTIIMSICVAFSQFGLTNELLSVLIKVAISLAVVQAVDGFILQPKIIGENAGLHPLVVMFALVLGGSIYGLLGMVLAVPTTCILKVLSRELYHELYDPV